METSLYFEILLNWLSRHRLSVFFVIFTLLVILLSAVLKWWWKRRWSNLLEEEFDRECKLDTLPSQSIEDQEAQKLIKKLRREAWEMPEAELRLSLEVFTHKAVHIARSIAGIYNPKAKMPEYEASLMESLQLIRRVTSKLIRLSSVTPLRFFGNQRLSDYQKFYSAYRRINDSPLLQKLKRHKYLYRAARWAINIKNLGNPLYWVGKELSREGYFFMLRWFYLMFITHLGKEAMRLYGKRHFQRKEDRDAVLACHRLFALTQEWGGPSSEEWATLVNFVTQHSSLEDEMKLQILTSWSSYKLPQNPEMHVFQSDLGVKWYHEGLRRLLEIPSSSWTKTQMIRRELDSAGNIHNKDVSAKP